MKAIKTSCSMGQYLSQLRKAGFRKIGKGAYASVYAHPTNTDWVVKVGKVWDIPENDGYLGYLRAIGKRRSNSLFPRVHSVTLHKWSDAVHDEDTYYYVVVLEKLEKLTGNHWDQVNLLDLVGQVATSNKLSMILPFLSRQLREFVTVLAPLFKNTAMYCDMHSGNFMLRKSGQLVITDPVASD